MSNGVDTGANITVVCPDVLSKQTFYRLRPTKKFPQNWNRRNSGSVWKTKGLVQDWGDASLS